MRKLMNAEEAYIMYKVNLVVDVDKDELLKALQYDRGQYEKVYMDRDAELVRCKDCGYRDDDGRCSGRGWFVQLVPDDGFCDKGERRKE